MRESAKEFCLSMLTTIKAHITNRYMCMYVNSLLIKRKETKYNALNNVILKIHTNKINIPTAVNK